MKSENEGDDSPAEYEQNEPWYDPELCFCLHHLLAFAIPEREFGGIWSNGEVPPLTCKDRGVRGDVMALPTGWIAPRGSWKDAFVLRSVDRQCCDRLSKDVFHHDFAVRPKMHSSPVLNPGFKTYR